MRVLIEFVNKIICIIKAKRRVKFSDKIRSDKKCINLGCGLAVTTNWVNIDGSLNALFSSLPSILYPVIYHYTGAKRYYSCEEYCDLMSNHVFLHHELTNGIPYNDYLIDYIYSSHFLEHLSKNKAQELLRESFRVLKKDGVIRLVVPDLQYAISLYAEGKKEEMLEQYFFVEDDDASFSRHRYMYDFKMLKSQLLEIGFIEVKQCDFKNGTVPDCRILDNRPDESLFVEARK
jgi:predicted SAM-dependent methyltransferase